MSTFQIQNIDGTLSDVSHEEFYEILNGEDDYLYYKQGGKHLAMLPTATNAETIRICRQAENAEYEISAINARCRDVKGQPCRYQHDASGHVIRNEKGHAIRAKCADCPRDGWTAGKRENCCIRNYCKVEDCTYCPHHREYNAPISLDWLPESKRDYGEIENAGFYIADPDSDIQALLESDELNSALHIAINQLPSDEQAVVKAVYWDKLSLRAYAAESGMAKDTVRRLHDRALESLKNILKNFR
jgi:RNA polymerase sigma factor (sigma-70 family)